MEQKEVLKMLRAIANTQSAMRGEMLSEFKKVREDAALHRHETDLGFKNVNKRIALN